jgi:lysophospholipase L1-like esterase
LLLAFGALAAALVLGEVVYRAFGPVLPVGAEEQGFILTPSGERVPSSEIYHFMVRRGDISDEGEGPRGHLQPSLETRMGYRHPLWAYYDRDGCITIRNNSLGFRDDEFPVQKPPGEWRAIALGDSFTYGMGVQAKDNWPTVLERSLAAHRGGPVQVINAGMACGNGARSAAEYAPWLAREGMAFAPDLVILGFCLNDVSDDVPMLSYVPAKYEPVLWGISRLLDSAVFLRRMHAARAADRRPALDAILDSPAAKARWQAVQEGLRAIAATCASAKVPFVVAVFPMISQLDGPYPYERIHAMVGEFCKREGIRCVDLLPAFRGRTDESLWVHGTDQHPNDVGHRWMADGIFAFLREQQLLPAAGR